MKRAFLLSVVCAVCAAATLVGCGGDQPYDPALAGAAGPVATDFAIAPLAAQNVVAGFTTAVPVTVTLIQSHAATRAVTPVTLSVTNLPSNVTASLVTNPVTPTEAGTTVTLNLTGLEQQQEVAIGLHRGLPTPKVVRGGGSQITISGTDGVHTHSIQVTVNFSNGPVFNFGAINTVNVTQGDNTTQQVTVKLIEPPLIPGDVRPVHLTVTGLQAGVTATFNPSTVTPTQAGVTTTLTVTADPNAPTGITNVTAQGIDGVYDETAPFTINVEEG